MRTSLWPSPRPEPRRFPNPYSAASGDDCEFQRLIRFSLSDVHLGLRGQVKQAVRWR